MKGIYLSADQVAQLMDQAQAMREQADAQLARIKAQNRAELDAYYIHKAVQAPRDGNVIDITEHLTKRHESH